jgi:hypothetical protein
VRGEVEGKGVRSEVEGKGVRVTRSLDLGFAEGE